MDCSGGSAYPPGGRPSRGCEGGVVRERVPVPVVQQGRGARRPLWARVLWGGGEAAVTLGLVLLLFVAHQLWWTNRQARAAAERTVQALEEEWGASAPAPDSAPAPAPAPAPDSASDPDSAPAPTPASDPASDPDPASSSGSAARSSGPSVGGASDQAYAILRIPELGVRVPVAEGIRKSGVLDQGYVGHYPRTAQPGRAGNFALAGHRNTHGEPFRYINRLRRGDELRVETRSAVYTYVVDKLLERTSARDGGVLRDVPRSEVRKGYGYGAPGYYITLTTCTPEYTSKYRLVVWGTLRSMRPR
ncbi:class E sortase [Streptomyces sp. KN37]|uniref:class E sortase n=1 Tax=Streptomyces sp. KN37 TaxID=3090667 RepID=UPI0039BE3C69